ncbi:hypothetical protein [Clostridium sp. VAP52]|uniref:hypothetical protein n=1 Tax=Clostridium sp. VAP52 TaxID=2949977 RepID=UPI00207A53C9|nr:hypothetical protein [Clostridium sp. VAP52]
MRSELRKAKIENPIILLENNNILIKPFIINGNHSITKAYQAGKKTIQIYKLNPDDIVECLSNDGYKEAYQIYKELQKYIPFKLNC